MFSKIAAKLHGRPNELYRIRDERIQGGRQLHDLISGNFNEHGFLFPQDSLEEILLEASRRCRVYSPDSFGQRSAREAVSVYYRDSGRAIDPGSVLITPGSSLSYWYCFRLLADEGDEILCPCPSYPLFDYIALLCGVRLISYRLEESEGWRIDFERLENSISTKTRAIVLISPHNPTGHVATEHEIGILSEIASRHDLAVLSDEVFSEFLIGPGSLPRPDGSALPLLFTLNGFSKMFALPGLKFGWVTVTGSPARVRGALRALEMISDTFLPVNEIVQAAAPEIFRRGRPVRQEFARRIRACWKASDEHLRTCRRLRYVPPGGGFYVTLSLNEADEEKAAESALLQHGLLLHPGYFYDMDPDHLILSFVQRPETLESCLPRLISTLERLPP